MPWWRRATTSTDVVLTDQLKRLLQCPICFETVTEPRTLPCFHSFCKSCLEIFVKNQRGKGLELNCAKCRTEFTLNEGSVEEMKQNDFVLSILNLLALQDQNKCIPCAHNCPKAAVARCVTCEKFMCTNCLKDHNNFKGFVDHSVLSMSDLSKPENKGKIKGTAYCKEHKDQKLRLYCETCEKTTCQDCIILGDHPRSGHNCSLLETVVKARTVCLQTDSKTLDQLLNDGNKIIQELRKYSQSLDYDMKATEQKIVHHKKYILRQVEEMLNKKCQALINDARRTFNKRKEAIDKKIEETKSYVSKVSGTVDMTKCVLERGSEQVIVSTQKDIQRNVKKLQNEKPKDERSSKKDAVFEFEETATILIEEIVTNLNNIVVFSKKRNVSRSPEPKDCKTDFLHSEMSRKNDMQSNFAFPSVQKKDSQLLNPTKSNADNSVYMLLTGSGCCITETDEIVNSNRE